MRRRSLTNSIALGKKSILGLSSRPGLPLRSRLVLAFDRLLQHMYGIREFDDDPRCILRISTHPSEVERVLHDGTVVRIGDPLIELHFWNEHLPRKDPTHPVPWSDRLEMALRFSLGRLVESMERTPGMEGVVAAFGMMSLVRPERYQALMEHLGASFRIHPARTPWQRFRQRVDHAYARLLARGVHPHHTCRVSVDDLQRVEIWISRAGLMRSRSASHP